MKHSCIGVTLRLIFEGRDFSEYVVWSVSLSAGVYQFWDNSKSEDQKLKKTLQKSLYSLRVRAWTNTRKLF